MTIRYVGPGGNDGWAGTTWATRKLTLNGVEDTPVVAGDVVYIGPGTYRELLTVDVSGGAGNTIQYIGDYDGSHTDGVGGVIRITGSNNDIVAVRAYCITANAKNYRQFSNILFDMPTANNVYAQGGCTDWTMTGCLFGEGTINVYPISVAGAGQARWTIQNCIFGTPINAYSIFFNHTVTVDNAAHVVQNCYFYGTATSYGVGTQRVGGITVRNCAFNGGNVGCRIVTALTVGQTMVVNNCVFYRLSIGVTATVLGEILENYNSFYGNGTDRTNVAIGANSNTYPPLFDSRWFFQLVTAGAGPGNAKQVVTLFDLASYSLLVNVAGTNPTATDMRGTGTIGAAREWGALEYDSTLKLAGCSATSMFSPVGGQIVKG